MVMVRVILVLYTTPLRMRPRMDTSLVNGHFLSMYVPAIYTQAPPQEPILGPQCTRPEQLQTSSASKYAATPERQTQDTGRELQSSSQAAGQQTVVLEHGSSPKILKKPFLNIHPHYSALCWLVISACFGLCCLAGLSTAVRGAPLPNHPLSRDNLVHPVPPVSLLPPCSPTTGPLLCSCYVDPQLSHSILSLATSCFPILSSWNSCCNFTVSYRFIPAPQLDRPCAPTLLSRCHSTSCNQGLLQNPDIIPWPLIAG